MTRRLLRGLWRTLGGVFWLALLLACGVAFAVVVFLAKPHLFLNTRTASYALKRFGASYAPRWKDFALEVRSPGFLTKRVTLHAQDFCVAADDGSMKGCLPRLGLDATLSLGGKPIVSVARIDELTIHADKLTLDSRRSAPRKTAKKRAPMGFVGLPEFVPAPLRATRLRKLDVRVSGFVSRSSSGTLAVVARAAFAADSGAPLLAHAYIVNTGTTAAQITRYKADVTLDSDLLREGRLTFLKATAKVRGDAVADVRARVFKGDGEELRAKVDATVKSQGKTLFAKLGASQTPKLYAAQGRVGMLDPAGPLRRLELLRCRFEAPLRDKTNRPTRADLACSLELEPAPFGAPAGARAKTLSGRLRLRSEFPTRLAGLKQDAFAAKLEASVGPSAQYYHFFAKLEAKFAGRTGRLPESLKAEHKLDAGFRLDRFQDLVAYLKGTAYAIPAPLHVLEGPVAVSMRSSGPTRGEDHGFEYHLRADLAHGRQRALAAVNGRLMIKNMFSPSRALSSHTEVALRDVAVELPYLKIGAFPSLSADLRIKTGDPQRDAAADAKRRQARGAVVSTGDHVVRIRTEKPVRLFNNLTKEPVPIALDLVSKPAGMEGRVQILPFSAEIFKQTAHVDHITLTPHPGSAAQDMDGKIVYKKNDVTINILLLGSTDKPQVNFESDPPMARDEIVAVLFYGKSPGELDSEQQATVGNASAGMANGAFGVLSLYLLAETPIDYVGYDPVTQTYQARFKLPGGATLSLGSNLEESRTLTLRKRIMKNVELETGVRRTPGQANAITTFLQWFRRY